jgi:hypothetical protein
MYNQFKNGRVTLDSRNEIIKDFTMIDKSGEKKKNFQVESLYGIQETSELNHIFFSKKNMDLIQDMIRYNVYIKSDKRFIIDRQSDIELQIVMRGIYLQYSPNLQNKIREQLEYLNGLVRDWCTEQIIPEVEQYVGYMKEIEYMPVPIDLPVNLSSKGSRSLRSVTTTF